MVGVSLFYIEVECPCSQPYNGTHEHTFLPMCAFAHVTSVPPVCSGW